MASPLKAIRKNCIACASGSLKEVRFCSVVECPLWSFRLGKRPETVGSQEGGNWVNRAWVMAAGIVEGHRERGLPAPPAAAKVVASLKDEEMSVATRKIVSWAKKALVEGE